MCDPISPPKGLSFCQNPVAASHSSYSSGIWANGEVILRYGNIIYLYVRMCDPISPPKGLPFHQNPLLCGPSPPSSFVWAEGDVNFSM